LVEAALDTAEWVAGADLAGVDAAHAPVELSQGAAVDLLACSRCQSLVLGVFRFKISNLGTSGTRRGRRDLLLLVPLLGGPKPWRRWPG